MRIPPLPALILACSITTTGLASDVVYDLNESTFGQPVSPISIRPDAFKFLDRSWAAPGVEQSTRDLMPPIKFDFAAKPRIHIVHPDGGAPEWLDDAAWPLTRELYGLGCPTYPFDDHQVFSFGLASFQR